MSQRYEAYNRSREQRRRRRKKDALAGVTAAVLGLVSIGGAGLLHPYRRPDPDYSVCACVHAGIETLDWIGLGLLFLSGVALGFLFCRNEPRSRPAYLGLATMSAFPVLSIIEGVIDPTSHNLMLFEFLIYLVLSLVPMAGAFTGMAVAVAMLDR